MVAILRRPARGDDVKKLQRLLNAKGAVPRLIDDGAFGKDTETALKDFQRRNGLNPDGVAGPKTWGKLGVAGPYGVAGSGGASQSASSSTDSGTSEGMRVIRIQRMRGTSRSTISTFSIEGTNISGYFLEPAGPSTSQANRNQRIPAGTYSVVRNEGSRFPGVPRLYNGNVSLNRAVLIHAGNTPNDTRGCLLPGGSSGEDRVNGSRDKLRQIMSVINSVGFGNVKIEIREVANT